MVFSHVLCVVWVDTGFWNSLLCVLHRCSPTEMHVYEQVLAHSYMCSCVCVCMKSSACLIGKGKFSPGKGETEVSNEREKLDLVNISWKFQLMRSS